jgi:large subunit ribosomal protein L15
MAKDILSNLTPAKGSRKKVKRIGRGQGSGHGGTATKGHKGAKARSGHKFKLWFEGGQMPLTRRVPKYGFTPRKRNVMQIVNIETLGVLVEKKKVTDGVVTPEILFKVGATSKKDVPVKILGDGELKVKLDVKAHAFSKSAISKIESAGGKTKVLTRTSTNS